LLANQNQRVKSYQVSAEQTVNKPSGSVERRNTPKNNVMNRRSTNKTPTGFVNSEQRPSHHMSALKNSKLAELGGIKQPNFFENKGKMSDLHKNAMHIKKLNV
jgi:hypothetical protein